MFSFLESNDCALDDGDRSSSETAQRNGGADVTVADVIDDDANTARVEFVGRELRPRETSG